MTITYDLKAPGAVVVEAAIRDLAAKVIALVDTRKHHPTYGVTKGAIRDAWHRLDGAIGVYLTLTGQTMHAHAATNVVVFDTSNGLDTAGLLNRARDAYDSIR